jgi:SapC
MTSNTTSPTSTSPAAANDTAKNLYVRLEALDRDLHRTLKFKPTDYGFSKAHLSASIVCGEFADVALVYPIVFVANESEKIRPMAAFGVREGENLFVTADGKWDAPYVPALVRQYPFTAAPDADGKMVAAIDAGSPWFNAQNGEPLFDDKGEPAEVTQHALQFMQNLQSEYNLTEQFCELLKSADLLQTMDVSVPVPGGKEDERLSVGGFMAVNEEKLRALPDATVTAWFKSGALPLIYAHLFSLRNFNKLMAKALA